MAHLISLRCFWKRQDIWEGLIILICIKSCFQDRKCKKRYTKCKKRLQYMDYGGRRRYTYDIPIWQMIKTIVKLCVEHWSCVRIGWKMTIFGDSSWLILHLKMKCQNFLLGCWIIALFIPRKVSKSRYKYLKDNT